MTKHMGAVVVTLLTAAGTHAFADEAPGQGCHPIHASIVDSKTTEGCTSPNAFCAAGTVQGNLGLSGTTYFTLDGVVRGPASAPGFIATSGVLVYTTRHGTLTVRETGASRPQNAQSVGLVTAVQEVIEGTGRFQGATGHLYVASEGIDGFFYATVTGELCLP